MAKSYPALEDTTLWAEVQTIVEKSKRMPGFEFRGIVHTVKEDYSVQDFASIEVVRDYLNNIGDVKTVRFIIGLGDYVNRLYPYRANLEFSIRKIPLLPEGRDLDRSAIVETTRYKAIFNPKHNPPVSGGELENYDPVSMNNVDVIEVELELLDRSLEPLRIKTTGTTGSFQNQTVENIIRHMLGGESLQVLVDGKPAIDRIDIVQPDNTEVQPNVVIRHGTKITAVPSFLQDKNAGVYNAGIGTYYQKYQGKRTWFVYPTHHHERFDIAKGERVVLYAVPQDRLPQLDKSYWKDGRIIRVAITAQRLYKDHAEIKAMNHGGGFRMADARSFMKKPVEMGKDGPIGSRARLNHEVITKDQEDGLNHAPVIAISANPFRARSDVVKREGAQLDVVWENADPDLIYPGMPVKYVYLSEGRPASIRGQILAVHYMTFRVERNGAALFRTNCRLSIACEPQTKKPDLSTEKPFGAETIDLGV